MPHPVQLARERRGWSQSQLARLAGVSRQLIGSVESGVHAPRVDAALALAATLGMSAEELFAAPVVASPVVMLDPVGRSTTREAAALGSGTPVLAARVGARTVVAPFEHRSPWLAGVDAVTDDRGEIAAGAGQWGVSWLPGADAAAGLIAGCDPGLGVVAALLAQRSGRQLSLTHASSARSAAWLRDGLVHAAVVHGCPDELPSWAAGDGPEIDRYRFAGWQVGLAGPAGSVPSIERICEQGTPVVQRESGAGSQTAFLTAVTSAGAQGPPVGPVATSHLDATARVVHGASAAVTMQPAALAAGLAFTPLAEHAVELWVDRAYSDHPAVAALLELITDRALHRRLSAIAGYDTAATGTRITDASRQAAS